MNLQYSQTPTNHRTYSPFAIYSSSSLDQRHFTAHPIKSRPSWKCFFSNHNCVWVLCLTKTWCVRYEQYACPQFEVCSAGHILVYLHMTRTRVNYVSENMQTNTRFCHNLLMKCGHWYDKCGHWYDKCGHWYDKCGHWYDKCTPNTTQYVCTYVCMHVCTYVCMMYVDMYVYVCMYIYMCVCVCVYVRMYVCMYVCKTGSEHSKWYFPSEK
jgi:hypothetical protein